MWPIFAYGRQRKIRKDGSLQLSIIEKGKLSLGHTMVEGVSMEPTFQDGDLIRFMSYRWNPIKIDRGDIVTAIDKQGKKVVVKRAVATAGDLVKVNGTHKPVTVIPRETLKKGAFRQGYYKVKEGEIFIQGDNYKLSYDSRYYGPLPCENILGLVIAANHRKSNTKEKFYSLLYVINHKYI